MRHTFFYIRVESEARTGPRVEPAKLLRKATSLDEMSDYINTYVPDENRFCWDVIKTLEHSDHAPAVVAIEYPMQFPIGSYFAMGLSPATFLLLGSNNVRMTFACEPRFWLDLLGHSTA